MKCLSARFLCRLGDGMSANGKLAMLSAFIGWMLFVISLNCTWLSACIGSLTFLYPSCLILFYFTVPRLYEETQPWIVKGMILTVWAFEYLLSMILMIIVRHDPKHTYIETSKLSLNSTGFMLTILSFPWSLLLCRRWPKETGSTRHFSIAPPLRSQDLSHPAHSIRLVEKVKQLIATETRLPLPLIDLIVCYLYSQEHVISFIEMTAIQSNQDVILDISSEKNTQTIHVHIAAAATLIHQAVQRDIPIRNGRVLAWGVPCMQRLLCQF